MSREINEKKVSYGGIIYDDVFAEIVDDSKEFDVDMGEDDVAIIEVELDSTESDVAQVYVSENEFFEPASDIENRVDVWQGDGVGKVDVADSLNAEEDDTEFDESVEKDFANYSDGAFFDNHAMDSPEPSKRFSFGTIFRKDPLGSIVLLLFALFVLIFIGYLLKILF